MIQFGLSMARWFWAAVGRRIQPSNHGDYPGNGTDFPGNGGYWPVN